MVDNQRLNRIGLATALVALGVAITAIIALVLLPH